MSHISKYLFIAVVATSALMLTGCGESHYTPEITGRPAYSLTVYQLATRLGLNVQENSKPYYELTDANNRVLLFIYDNGRVYVNGASIGSVGTVTEYVGTHYFSSMLVPKIREHLVTADPLPVKPEPNLNFASGTVVIDPGHGGKDPGAQSVLGYWEKHVNLQIAQQVADDLRQSGVRVVMTREGDSFLELEERAALANRIDADLFVSIHCNTIAKSSHRGFIIFTAHSASWTSKKTARNIANSLSEANVPKKGVRNEDYRVLVQTQCPAVLVECGFMTNYDEAAQLQDPWYQGKLARAIADGVIKSL